MAELDDIFREFALAFLGRLKGAEGEIAMARSLRRAELDGTVASLRLVDEYLETLHHHQDELSEAEWHTTVLWGGAYVGEVIRYETDNAFSWTDYNDYMPRHPKLQSILPERTTATCAFLVLPDDYMSMPLNKIARFIGDGPENSVHFFASCDINRARK